MSTPPPPCSPDIFNNGTVVFMTHTIRSAKMEEWVKSVAADSGQPVDWHFYAGRAVVKALGDLEKVSASLEKLMPEHDRLMNEAR